MHVLPKVRVLQHGSKILEDATPKTEQHALLLKITNPTLGRVRLRLGRSNYRGESFWNDYDDDYDPEKKNPVLERLLIDTLSYQHVNALLLTPQQQQQQPSSSAYQTEFVELDSAEDAMIDFGNREPPAEVNGWTAAASLSSAAPPPSTDGPNTVVVLKTKCLAQHAGSAWWEVVCVIPSVTMGQFPAIPLALQIEVGDGSWESSLIQAKPTIGKKDDEDGGKDIVSFDLVLTWPPPGTTS